MIQRVMICLPTTMAAAVIVPGSKRRRCSACGCEVWLSPESQKVLDAKASSIILCADCFGPPPEMPEITEGQLKEARDTLRSPERN